MIPGCDQHSGVSQRLINIEEDVRDMKLDINKLWGKYDNVQKLLIGSLVTVVINLAGIVILLMK